jgi:adenylylsulfate kinase
MPDESREAFAVWLTGLPASGKSTLAAALRRALHARGMPVVVLESDALRRLLTPEPTYSLEERDAFYAALAGVGRLLVESGVAVIFDATAHRRAYRERARGEIRRFIEVYVDCPLDVCRARDPKGIYRRGMSGEASHVPGLQEPYEPPTAPALVVRGDVEHPDAAAVRILEVLSGRGYLPGISPLLGMR